MKPTDEERMEIVGRLRTREWRRCHPICVLNQIVFGGDCRDDCDDPETNGCEECEFSAAYRLSELIEPEPERTCVVEHWGGGVFYLSCGHDSTEHVKPDYCPTCGARVVD